MNQYWFAHRPISVIAPRMDKSCGRVADKFGLRTWTINLCTWIFGLTCQVFKTTYIDREKPLPEGTFFFARTALFPPLDKRNTRDNAKGLCITSERYIGGLGVRYLSIISRRQCAWWRKSSYEEGKKTWGGATESLPRPAAVSSVVSYALRTYTARGAPVR